MTTFLTIAQANQILADMKVLIESSGESATRSRQVINPVLYGGQPIGESIDQITFPILRKQLPESDLTVSGNAFVISVLPEIDIGEIDIVTIGSTHYGVVEVTQHNLFGVITHLDVKLEPYRSNQ